MLLVLASCVPVCIRIRVQVIREGACLPLGISLGRADDEKGGGIEGFGQGESRSGPQDQEGRRQGVRLRRPRRQHGYGCEPMGYRAPRHGIDGVGVTGVFVLEEVAVVAGGRQRAVIQRQDAVDCPPAGVRALDRDTPGQALAVVSAAPQLTADLDQIIGDAHCVAQIGEAIHAVSLGDGG